MESARGSRFWESLAWIEDLFWSSPILATTCSKNSQSAKGPAQCKPGPACINSEEAFRSSSQAAKVLSTTHGGSFTLYVYDAEREAWKLWIPIF